MDQEDKTLKKFILFLVLSVFLHLGLVLFVYESPLFRQEPTAEAPRQEVVFVNPQDIISPKSPRALEIADLAKPKVEKVPDRARFGSRYNSSVKEETVARKIPKKARVDVDVSDEKKGPKPVKRKPKKQPRKVAKQTEPKPSLEEPRLKEPSKLGKKGSSKSDLSLSDLQLRPSDFKDLMGDEGKADKAKAKRALKEDERRLAMIPRDVGSSGRGDRFVHDFFPHVKIGDKTYLNANALPDVQYFTRLKRVFRLRFNPSPPLRSYFAQNRVVAGKVNVTMAMEVTASGQLKRIFVMKSSGIPGYDNEAVRTVQQSAPFSAPPKKLMKDGLLRMTWHFTTYL